MYGTLALLGRPTSELVAGFVINKFRGEPALLDTGLRMLRWRTGRPVLGVLPFAEGLWLDVEDSLSLDSGPPWPATSWRRRERTLLRVSAHPGCRGSATSPTSTPWSAEPGV